MEPKTIQSELQDLIGQMSAQVTKPQEPVATTPNPDPSVQTTPAAVTEVPNAVPATTPVTEPAKVQEPAKTSIDVDAVVEDWETKAPTTAVPASATPVVETPKVHESIDFSEFAKVLNKETIKSKEELISTVQEKMKDAELLTKVPETLKKAIEIASLGGNYLEYLGVSQIDWAKEDPILLYENYVIDQYTDDQGQTNYEKADTILDKLDDAEKELRGRELQRQYITYQGQQKSQYEYQARQVKQNFEQAVRKGVEGITEIAGFKLSPSKKEELYSYVISGQDLNQQNIQTRLFNAFITKNWGALDSFRKTQIKNAAQKQLLDEVTVPNITPVGEPVLTPTTQTSGFSFDNYIRGMESKGGIR